jgi:3-phosphoshikimate 1-carboxyvinyltransferase
VRPFTRPVRGSVGIPGSKSLTNRALLLASLCDGPVTLSGALFSEDTRIMAEAIRRLGIGVEEDEGRGEIRVAGRGGEIPADRGPAFRRPGRHGRPVPDGPLRLREAGCIPAGRGAPDEGAADEGAHRRPSPARSRHPVPGEEGFLPVEVRARGLRGGAVAIDSRESSQMLSALLMVAPLAEGPVSVTPAGGVRMPFVG